MLCSEFKNLFREYLENDDKKIKELNYILSLLSSEQKIDLFRKCSQFKHHFKYRGVLSITINDIQDFVTADRIMRILINS